MQPVTIDLAVLRERAADRVERFRLRAVEEAAGVDDDEVGALVLARELVALGAQPRDDALAVDQRLGAAERDEADPGGRGGGLSGWHGAGATGDPGPDQGFTALALPPPLWAGRPRSGRVGGGCDGVLNYEDPHPQPLPTRGRGAHRPCRKERAIPRSERYRFRNASASA